MSSAAEQTATMFQYLQASGLLTERQLGELQGWIARKKPDIRTLGNEIARRGWLTAFQLKEIARNRAAGLRIADRYILIDVLGEGGMGRVYKAHDSRMGRDVAFKVIRKEKLKHPAAAGRFVQEMIALGKMTKHPNVVEVFTADQVGDNHFCVMEFIDGSDLTKIVQDKGPLSVPQACDIIRQAALGLEHACQTGLVHRDIKPSNIIVPRNNNGSVKLVDLGLARITDEPPGGVNAHRITQEGFVIGTPDFLAPEQARDPMSVDIRADIYSLGGTLFYILTGRVPYENGTATEKLIRHCTEPPPNLLDYRPDAPLAVQQIIHWSMAKEAKTRPQKPMELAVALLPFCPPPLGGGFAAAPSGLHTSLPAALVAAAPAIPNATSAPPQQAAPPRPVHGALETLAPFPETPAPIPADPVPTSQVFKLPPKSAKPGPARKPGIGKFPLSLIFAGVGGLFVIAAVVLIAVLLVRRADAPATPEPFTNGVNLKMVKLEGGKFRMGSPDSEAGHEPDEGPAREVTIRGPFFMSATEVTSNQYARVMAMNPSTSKKAKNADYLPVDSVSWDDANEFCRRLTEKEKDQPWARKGWAYRLPTEAEWEYACRAGTSAPFAFGDRILFKHQAMYRFKLSELDPYETGDKPDEPVRFAQAVGKTEANKFGLHDMHGNLAEWCSDWYKADAYRDLHSDNPTGPADGDRHVVRGGSFRDAATATRSAARDSAREPSEKIGFRVIYAPVQK